jgi:MFS transporter, ACS family, glucarate transporter
MPDQRPTRARYRVLFLGFLMALITYLDRICISVAAPDISRDLGLTNMQMGYVFSIFALSYAIFELPSGWLGDRIGQRKVLTRIVGGWSLFTVLTGLAWSYHALLAMRFWFGAAESGAFPTLARALARWFPQHERARANGVGWMGARLGGSLAPPLAALLIGAAGWRATFGLFGALGIAWCLVFWRWYRDDPKDHPDVNPLELAHIVGRAPRPAEGPQARPAGAPWLRIISSGTMWALFGMYFCSAYGFYFLSTWLPTFLMKDHGLSLQRSGFYAALPLGAGALGCLCGGALSDWLVRRTGNLKWARRSIAISGFVLAALGFALAGTAHQGITAALWLAFAEGTYDLSLPVSWATVVDVGGRFGGTTGAFMNMASSISAMISSVTAAWLAGTFGSFNAMLATAAAIYFLGGLLWLLIDPTVSVSA